MENRLRSLMFFCAVFMEDGVYNVTIYCFELFDKVELIAV